mmetsp:Transcript_45515/g.125687  ORF Transcript_45515/g.125687 Transcript_45515/m.125687 type:complete len:796 (+) Transcript_45515:30-2417(+)
MSLGLVEIGRGYARCMQQEWAAAVEDLERACKIEPAFATASETLAKARVQLKAAELRAAKAMDELLQGNPAKAAAGGDRAEGGGGGEIGDKKNKKKNKKNKKDKKNKKKSKNLSAAVDGDSGDEEGRGAGGGREERITSHPGLEDNEILTAGVLNTVLTSPTEIPLPQAELSMSTTAVGMLSSTTTEPVAKKQPASPSDSNAPQSSNRASPPVPTAVLFVTKPQPLKTSTPLSPSAPVFSPASKKARASSAPEFPSGGSLATTTTKAVVAGDHHESDADAMGLRVGDKSATYATTISAMNSAGTGLTFSPTQQLADMAAAPASVKTTSDVTAAATATIAATIAAIAMANSTAVDVATSTVASQGGADDSYLKVASEAGETAGSELVSALDVPVNRHAPIRTASLPNPPNLDAYVPLHMNPSPKRGRRVGRRHTHSMGSERPGSLEHWVKQQEEQSRARVISKDDNLVWTNPDAYVPLHMGPLVPSKIKGRRKSKTKTSISSERKNHSTTGTDAADGSTPRPRRNHTRRNDETDADNTVTGKHREPGRRRLRKMWGGTSGKRVNKSLDDDLLKIEVSCRCVPLHNVVAKILRLSQFPPMDSFRKTGTGDGSGIARRGASDGPRDNHWEDRQLGQRRALHGGDHQVGQRVQRIADGADAERIRLGLCTERAGGHVEVRGGESRHDQVAACRCQHCHSYDYIAEHSRRGSVSRCLAAGECVYLQVKNLLKRSQNLLYREHRTDRHAVHVFRQPSTGNRHPSIRTSHTPMYRGLASALVRSYSLASGVSAGARCGVEAV